MISKPTLASAAGIILIWLAAAIAQTVSPAREASDYNFELTNFGMPKYVGSVTAGAQHSGLYMNTRLRRIPDWKPSPDVPLAVSVLKTEFWIEGGGIRFELLAYLG